MRKPPSIPTKGPKAFRKLAKEAIDYMVATAPVAGAGVSVSELPGGSQLNAQGGGAHGRGVTTYFIRNGVLVTYKVLVSAGPTTVI